MPAPAKRTRSSPRPEDDDPPSTNSNSTPSTPSSRPSPSHGHTITAPAPRRSLGAAPGTGTGTGTTATRPPPTRHTTLTRSASLFEPSTRRGNANANTSSSALSSPVSAGPSTTFGNGNGNRTFIAPSLPAGPSRGAGATLVRTQSTSAIPSTQQMQMMKAGIPQPPSGGGRGKGDADADGFGDGRRFGKGKENVPPKIKERDDEDCARKRLRVGGKDKDKGKGAGSGSAGKGRGRSGSVASVRSESTTSGRPSLAGSSSFSQRRRLLSPSPSPSSATSFSHESSNTSDHHDDEMDVDKTPTKPKVARAAVTMLPTPPPSSPPDSDDVNVTTERMQMVRMKSSSSVVRSRGSSQSLEEEGTGGKSNPYKRLKAALRLSSSSAAVTPMEAIVGRAPEKAAIKMYLANKEDNRGMYISGPPGTGKTATVTALGRLMRDAGWQVVELGCMGLRLSDVWSRLGAELGCGNSEADVQEWINRGNKTFIILDEIDFLLPPPPALPSPAASHMLTKLFSLAYSTSSTVKVIAISNTLDLTLRARLVLPDGLQPQVVPFKAYGAPEMVDIVNARILSTEGNAEVAKVDHKSVELLTRKVEAQNGDLRMCLGCMAAAVSLAEGEWVKKVSAATGEAVPLVKVSLPHAIKAFNSYTQQLKAAAGSTTGSNTPTGKKIRSVQLQGKMVLVSVLVFLARVRAGLPGSPSVSGSSTGVQAKAESLTTTNLYASYTHLLSHHSSPFPPSPESDYRDLLSNLETLGLLSLAASSSSTSGRKGNASAGAKIELCVREDEVKEGLGLLVCGSGGKGLADEEVAKIWEREEGRVRRVKERVVKDREKERVDEF